MIDETRENIVEPKRNIIRKKRETEKRLGKKGIEIEIETEVRGG